MHKALQAVIRRMRILRTIHYLLLEALYVLKMAGFKNINIIDKDALAGSKGIKKWIKKIFLKLYILHIKFWCKMTNSAFQAPSPQVFSYEIEALAN